MAFITAFKFRFDFIRFLAEGGVEGHTPGRRERYERWIGLRGSMSLMPEWARELTGLRHSTPGAQRLSDALESFKAGVARWACPVLPCVELATERALGTPMADDVAPRTAALAGRSL